LTDKPDRDEQHREEDSSPAEAGATLHIPDSDGEIDIALVEDALIAAVEEAGAGVWEGHGFDLEVGRWDVRFYGSDAAALVGVLVPVLRSMCLPPGTYLLAGSDDEEAERIDL
jgi:hypothetical protein